MILAGVAVSVLRTLSIIAALTGALQGSENLKSTCMLKESLLLGWLIIIIITQDGALRYKKLWMNGINASCLIFFSCLTCNASSSIPIMVPR